MKALIMITLLLLCYPVWAHHSKEHTMLMQNPEQIIAETQQGADDSGLSILWLGVGFVFALGALKLINKK